MLTELYIFFLVTNDGKSVLGTTRTVEECRAMLIRKEKEFAEDKLPVPVMKCSTGFPEKGFVEPTSEAQNAIKKRKV